LANESFDLVAYSPLTYAFPTEYEAMQRLRGLLSPRDRRRRIAGAVAAGIETFDTIATLFDCPIVVHAPAPVFRHEGTTRDWLRTALITPGLRAATRKLGALIRAEASARNGRGQVIHVLDEAEALGEGGLWEAGRYLYHSKFQHPARFGALLAPL